MTTGDSRRKAALALASAFVVGGLVGHSATRGIDHRRGGRDGAMSAIEYRTRLVQTLTRDLDLDEGQRESVGEILDEIRERYTAVREAIEPELHAIREERAERVMALLDAEQRIKYQAILESRRTHRWEQVQRFMRGH